MNTIQFRTVFIGAILTIAWICAFLFIKPTLVMEFGAGINVNFKLLVVLVILLIIVLYHIFDRPNPQTTKLSLTVALTLVWISLIMFYPFNPTGNDPALNVTWPGGAVAFFTLIGGLGISVLWVYFLSEEIF